MADKTKLSGAGKVTAVLSLIFACTGAGYFLGSGEPDPFSQLAHGLQDAVEQEIAANGERLRQIAFVKNTCESIDDALDSAFRAAGAERDFSSIYSPPERRHGSCDVVLNGEKLYTFYDTEDFDPESKAASDGIPLIIQSAARGMTAEQLTQLQKTLPAMLKDLAP